MMKNVNRFLILKIWKANLKYNDLVYCIEYEKWTNYIKNFIKSVITLSQSILISDSVSDHSVDVEQFEIKGLDKERFSIWYLSSRLFFSLKWFILFWTCWLTKYKYLTNCAFYLCLSFPPLYALLSNQKIYNLFFMQTTK